MIHRILLYFFSFIALHPLCGSESFILIDGNTGEMVYEQGDFNYERVSPCSTFKIALSLMGFDSGILEDDAHPEWGYQMGFDDFLESWKAPQTPRSWLKTSCVWYSRELASLLGLETIQEYLKLFNYGNQDFSGGLRCAWLSSTLMISPQEQTEFIRKMVIGELSISTAAIQVTKSLLFQEDLEGWRLYGKTGYSGTLGIGWFVGWLESEDTIYPFAYQIRGQEIALDQRIPRTKQLISKALPPS